MHILVHIFIANLLCCAIYSKALTKNQEEGKLEFVKFSKLFS